MVRKICLAIALSLAFFDSFPQESSYEYPLEFKLSLSSDTVSVNDSLKICLSFKNITDSVITFYPNAIIGLCHNHPNVFITYSEEHLIYSLRNKMSCDGNINIQPNTDYREVFSIAVDSSFFYIGNNEIWGLYHFHSERHRVRIFNKRKKQGRIVISLNSSYANLYIQDKANTFIE